MGGNDRTRHVLDRLRANLRAAGIPATDADIAGAVEKGFLGPILLFEELARSVDVTEPPEDLGRPYAPSEAGPESVSTPSAPLPPTPRALWRGDAVPPAVTAIAPLIHSRKVSPVEITRRSLERIGERDSVLNAFQLVPAEDALRAAREAETEMAAGRYRGPLHGLPVAVKDLLDVRGMPTTAGSRAMPDTVADDDAAVVRRLRRAGAVIVGKTRLSELAYSPGSNNAHFGPTRNPWNPEHDAGGSSSGSAAAVADGMVYAALGSDTGGSIRIPAAHCGLVGLKPTYGRVSVRGAVPLSWSLDHLGALTQTVADAALLLETLTGYGTNGRESRTGTAFRADLAALESGVRGARVGAIGVEGADPDAGTPEALNAWRAGVAALRRAGAEVAEVGLPELGTLRHVAGVILVLEAAAYHEARLRARLHDLGPFPRQRLLCAYALPPTALAHARRIRAALRRRVEEAVRDVDLITTPTTPSGAPPLGIPASTRYTAPFNALGWPAITVPVGRTPEGLPLGLQLAARPWREDLVLRAARVVEAEGPWHGRTVPPHVR